VRLLLLVVVSFLSVVVAVAGCPSRSVGVESGGDLPKNESKSFKERDGVFFLNKIGNNKAMLSFSTRVGPKRGACVGSGGQCCLPLFGGEFGSMPLLLGQR